MDDVRDACRAIAEEARFVRIDAAALSGVAGGTPPALDPVIHFLEGSPEEVAAYVLALDAVNFGSGWFAGLGAGFGYERVAGALAAWRRAEGALDAAALRAVDGAWVAEVLGFEDASHELAGLYAAALRELGDWLGGRTALDAVRAAGPSAEALVAMLAELPMWRDVGFLKRAQIAASDLALAGVATFADVGRLTAFADNVLPQVLRVEGVLVVDDALATRIARGELLAAGSREERELRACAVHACELLAARLGMTPRELDNVLWTRGQDPAYAAVPPHRTQTTFY